MNEKGSCPCDLLGPFSNSSGPILNSLREATVRLFDIFQGDAPLPCPVDYEIEFRIGDKAQTVYAFLTEEAAGQMMEELPGLLDLDSSRTAPTRLPHLVTTQRDSPDNRFHTSR